TGEGERPRWSRGPRPSAGCDRRPHRGHPHQCPHGPRWRHRRRRPLWRWRPGRRDHRRGGLMAEPIERNLGLDLVRVTETAALGAARWLGRGDKEAVDQAAVDGMRLHLSTLDIDGIVVIGEGEKDEAPMLYNGERVG